MGNTIESMERAYHLACISGKNLKEQLAAATAKNNVLTEQLETLRTNYEALEDGHVAFMAEAAAAIAEQKAAADKFAEGLRKAQYIGRVGHIHHASLVVCPLCNYQSYRDKEKRRHAPDCAKRAAEDEAKGEED